MSPPKRLSELLPPVVAVLIARHHQPRTENNMSEQTLTDWCAWLRNDLAYRAPELWPDAIDAWLRSTEDRFGERSAATSAEPLPEVQCPQCGATIRARMADRDYLAGPYPTLAELLDALLMQVGGWDHVTAEHLTRVEYELAKGLKTP